jgi:uracil-DNA glycosylase
VPPDNKPLPVETNTCRQFLSAQLTSMPDLRAVLTLRRVAHDSVCKALGIPARAHPFVHGGLHRGKSMQIQISSSC